MLTQSIIAVALVVFASCLLVSSNPYGPTYNDGDEYQPQQAPSYQPPSYGPSYQQAPAYQPAPSYQPAPAYHAPAYPKYQAPSSAHHTQYDNYYPKQTYSKPMYSAPKPYAPPPAAYAPPTYSAPKPSYPAPAYGGHHDMEEYKV